jgi:hypothetical protein
MVAPKVRAFVDFATPRLRQILRSLHLAPATGRQGRTSR